ncbi:MAG: hypothetical protein GY861_26365 [bacterium]|nr:hypothetical protein [bacterium]
MKYIKTNFFDYYLHKEKKGADYFYLCDYDCFCDRERFDIAHFNDRFSHKTTCKSFDYFSQIEFLIVQRFEDELEKIGYFCVAEAYKKGHESRFTCDIQKHTNDHMVWMNYFISFNTYADIRSLSSEGFPTYPTMEASFNCEYVEQYFNATVKRALNNSNVLALYDTDNENEIIECLYAALDHKAVKESNKNKQRERSSCLVL